MGVYLFRFTNCRFVLTQFPQKDLQNIGNAGLKLVEPVDIGPLDKFENHSRLENARASPAADHQQRQNGMKPTNGEIRRSSSNQPALSTISAGGGLTEQLAISDSFRDYRSLISRHDGGNSAQTYGGRIG
jgi:hypothetical protein